MPKKGVIPKQLQGWMSVVRATRAAHPSADYKRILELAAPAYHKLKKQHGL